MEILIQNFYFHFHQDLLNLENGIPKSNLIMILFLTVGSSYLIQNEDPYHLAIWFVSLFSIDMVEFMWMPMYFYYVIYIHYIKLISNSLINGVSKKIITLQCYNLL